jgi:hypothetical protein
MPPRTILFALSIALLAVTFGAEQVRSQTLHAGEGLLNASGFRPISDGAKVSLQLADDSDINLRLRDVAVRALTRAGYVVVEEGAAYTLRLESERLLQGANVDRSIGSLRAGSSVGRPIGNSSGPRGDGVDLNLKLWSSTRNSLLSPKSAGAAPKQGFGVVIEAFDETARKPAWHGIARAPDAGGDSYRAGSAMVKHLIDALGHSINGEIVSLR